MEKVDLKKQLKQIYNPSAKEISDVDVPVMNFLMIDGQGNPNTSPDYVAAIECLFSVSYTLKFMIKKQKGVDYGVLPLEGLWWMDDMTQFSVDKKDEWKWTAMIIQPPCVTEEDVKVAVEQVKKKKNPVALSKLRFESFTEGTSAQILYFGPYAEEGTTIQKIHEHIKAGGHQLFGKHHEIYLNNVQTVAPEKLKTVIRQPFR
ncbi:MAG: GyrI-like domain-containing protein [Candidatus Bathyarchaeota archaeon]|nr:GyrI-like domain-containing protein [Candidatus Bathyarchaeota archaeon]